MFHQCFGKAPSAWGDPAPTRAGKKTGTLQIHLGRAPLPGVPDSGQGEGESEGEGEGEGERNAMRQDLLFRIKGGNCLRHSLLCIRQENRGQHIRRWFASRMSFLVIG